MLARKLTQQLGHPTQSLGGWLVTKFLERRNRALEERAVRLCEIQPDSTVLEVGFGPGLGLQEAVQYLTDPRGKLLGLDCSEYMHKVASERLRDHIASGKVRLFQGSVESIPLPACSVDKVYHCNCYYFWPDLRAGSAELHRVMKPGALMVTTLNMASLKEVVSCGVLQDKKWPPEPYMEALRSAGFTDVRLEEKQNKGRDFQAIFATAAK
ncbi:uncharacterized methyltransferase YdaC-like [Polyodon spathula]|uniref:uncharacterized methyltransferase YdaC-like n=1 Tax=Polyodon spathula TaxID=7913 RepID=UPI001B7E6CD5|nr:uncharacterized methyltransferase YdaC-like [Polyodon spathula]XP_041083674.1 uncharacterized methyltransferase YdaC-like [Polyodon spathula]XP_041083675.1 uncharacterized methyltransferase YdaC-like [Polyodon spathula]XP_041083676.1 uncharacterized methyltransferase YdaC-like [Polyodon spathula]